MAESLVTCVIPARLTSTRFPGKLIKLLQGRPLIQHTIARAQGAACFKEVVCLTDSQEIEKAAAPTGCRIVLTKPARNGTERIAANLESISTDLIVNLQGDEPLFPVSELISLCSHLKKDPSSVHILYYPLSAESEELWNSHRVKVLLNSSMELMDFKRQPDKSEIPENGWTWGVQMGVYGYPQVFLRNYLKAAPSDRELSEAHELLRVKSLKNIKAHKSEKKSVSVDLPEDLEKIQRALSKE
jgi:3-deoxy-manno-octulosonate cytidylyltransferase (CMP-KDO synthetase)